MKTSYLSLLVLVLISIGACSTKNVTPVNSGRWVQWYKNWQGTPYQYGGTGKSGIDCSALVKNAYRSIYGLQLPRTTKEQRRVGRKVSKRALQVGDLLFFKPAGTPNHVGVYIGSNRFIHASSSKGVTIATLSDEYWLPKLVEARRAIK